MIHPPAMATATILPTRALKEQDSRFRIVPVLVASVLMAGCLLKGYGLLTSPPVQRGLLSNSWFILLVANFELFLALWLFSGLYPRRSWLIAISTFFCFFAVSFFLALAGERSCAGCFGPLEVAPWFTAALDAGIVLLLALVQLPPVPHPTRQSHPRRFARVTGLGLTLAVSALVAFSVSRSGGDILVVSDPVLDFGELPQGSYREKLVTLTNTGPSYLRITNIESTCPCLALQLEKVELNAGEQTGVMGQLNLGKEPDYLGLLAVHVVGHTEVKEIRFRLVVTVGVVCAPTVQP